MTSTFKDLYFRAHRDDVQSLMFFVNGYGVSVTKTDFSYGGSQGLYALDVLKGTEDEWSLCYDTYITSGVEGYLNEEDVSKLMFHVQHLTKKGTMKWWFRIMLYFARRGGWNDRTKRA